MEQTEPPGRRLVDDDLAVRFLPAPTRWLVTATPPKLMRRLMMAALPRLCQELVLAQSQLAPLTDVLFGHITEAMYVRT